MLVKKKFGSKIILVRKEFLSFFSWAEQCHTQHFYIRFFQSDLVAVKSKFDLLIMYYVNPEDDHKNEEDLKNEDNLKNEDELKNEVYLKYEDDLKMKDI